VLCEHVFRPLAHVVVLALAPLRVPPPAVVLLAAARSVAGSMPRPATTPSASSTRPLPVVTRVPSTEATDSPASTSTPFSR
jgi:hypothetical protein